MNGGAWDEEDWEPSHALDDRLTYLANRLRLYGGVAFDEEDVTLVREAAAIIRQHQEAQK